MPLESEMICEQCRTPIAWVYCPTGGWWAHDQHPSDGHDALPMPADAAEGGS